MTKRQLYLTGLTLLFFFLALGFDFYNQQSIGTQQYASTIEKFLHKNENEINTFFGEKEFIARQLNNNLVPEDFSKLKTLYEKDYTICIYAGDSLAFWSNNDVLPSSEIIEGDTPNLSSSFHVLSNGYYEVLKKSFNYQNIGKYTVFGFIPIKYNYGLESSYLENNFKADENIPHTIGITKFESPIEIKNKAGDVLCYLATQATQDKDPIKQRILFALYAMSFIFFGIFANNFAKNISINRKPWMGFASIVVALFGARYATIQMGFSSKFTELSIFEQNFNSPVLGDSLGDLVINILLLFWVMVFFHTEYRVRPTKNLKFTTRIGLTILNYFSIILGILMISVIFQQLVFNTKINFDFAHIFNLNQNSFVAIMSSLLLLVALFLFSQRIMETILKLGLTKFQRLGALGLAALASIPIIIYSNSNLPIVEMVIIGYTFNLIFDIYLDYEKPNFIWLVIWLVVFALIPSILLFKYNNDMDFDKRQKYAVELSDLKDRLAEESLAEVRRKIKADQELKNSFKPYPFTVPSEPILNKIEKHFTDDIYLYNNYQYEIHAFTKNGSAFDSIASTKDIVEEKVKNATSTRINDLKFLSLPNNKNSYLLSFRIPIKESEKNYMSLVLEVERNRRDQSKVFTELLIQKEYKELDNLSNYEYALYDSNESLIYKEGKTYDAQYQFDKVPTFDDNPIEIRRNRKSHLVFRSNNNNLVVIGKELPTHRRIITLFAFLFVLLLVVNMLLVAFNSIFKNLPKLFNLTFDKVMSIRTRIQMSVIVLTVIFFFSIGFVTVRYFSDEREQYHEGRLDRKGKAILTDTNLSLSEFYQKNKTKKKIDYKMLIERISKIHRMDVNIYNTNGSLISSSEDDVFEKGIISPSMDAIAFNALSKMGMEKFTQEKEKVGSLEYKSAYLPLRLNTNEGEKTIAYMGLPYYSKQRELRDDVNVFMGTLLNVYVFLLLIAGAIAILITNSITRPIARIGEKLKEFKLGKRNEPLEWQSKDELGELIEEYNRLIKKVEESAEKLAHQEREGAWREMAKQVAHEIKNPLTPMKLSIQYLLHAYRSNPEDIAPLLKRVSGTLIEQIDNLASIASEFSNFAKMPRADNQKLVVNDLVQSVFDLFHEGESKVVLDLKIPEENLMVFADKNHLIQVLNNLIKNATQAIPDHRKGYVIVSLSRQEDTAVIMVKDNGTGIPEDKWNKVFVPNFTTKNSGTGLGLAISKNIIESVNGKIYFETIIDEGTEFFVELPIIEVREMEEV